MRILIFGGAPTPDQAPASWLGHTWHMRFGAVPITRPRHQMLPQVDRDRLEQTVREAAEYDLIFCETEFALILVREWQRHGLPQRPILALEVNALEPLRALRRWYRVVLEEDPWPLLRDAPWVSWVAATPTQRDLLLAEGVPPAHLSYIAPSTSLFRCLWSDSPAHFEEAAAGNVPHLDTAGVVLFPGTGRRDWKNIIRTAHAVPELPFVILGERRRELDLVLGRLGQPWPANLRHIEQVPLPEFIHRVAAARLIAVPLLPGLGDGGHTTAIIAYRVGTPVVCTDSPGLAGIHDGGESVSLVPPADTPALAEAIRQLWSDEALRTRRIDAARRFERRLDETFEMRMSEALTRAAAHAPKR